jgi:RNA polymerase sigma-70 factor (ECF subfamily)
MKNDPETTVPTDDDDGLVRAINSGRQELFHTLVRRYERKLYSFGFRLCRDVQDAEDLVQETFLNAFRYMKDFRFETKFKNWLYKIASNVCIKKRRRSKYAPERELSLEEFLPAEDRIPTEAPEWASAPLDKILDEELSRRLKEAVLSLPEKYRLVVALRDLEGFGTEETAQILNLSVSNVKVRLHRGRLFLKEKLKGYFENDRARPSP